MICGWLRLGASVAVAEPRGCGLLRLGAPVAVVELSMWLAKTKISCGYDCARSRSWQHTLLTFLFAVSFFQRGVGISLLLQRQEGGRA